MKMVYLVVQIGQMVNMVQMVVQMVQKMQMVVQMLQIDANGVHDANGGATSCKWF